MALSPLKQMKDAALAGIVIRWPQISYVDMSHIKSYVNQPKYHQNDQVHETTCASLRVAGLCTLGQGW